MNNWKRQLQTGFIIIGLLVEPKLNAVEAVDKLENTVSPRSSARVYSLEVQ